MASKHANRRLAAILAADVAGYSRLMGHDEAGTLTRLKSIHSNVIFPKLSEYRGRVVKKMGDGLLVEFSSVVEAVQCAVDIQKQLNCDRPNEPKNHRLEFRIGINVGDIIVEDDDVFGDGVNIAARIEALAEPGGIALSGDAYRQVKSKIDLMCQDLGECELKNIADPVRVYRVNHATAADMPTDLETVLARPALAVLPLVNLGSGAEQEYFVDGLTEDIITALSCWRSFPVIARNSTFAYKGESIDVREAGEKLGARYVLEGSVRKSAERIRVSVQLIDAATGHQVWAEKFDRTVNDIFDLQDEITQKIAAKVAPELERAERKRASSRPKHLNAWELHHRGMSYFYQKTREGNATAREYFRKAMDADPSSGTAHASLAWSYHDEVAFWQAAGRDEILAKALTAAQKAVELDDADSYANTILGMVYLRMGEHEFGLACCRRAIALNPSNALAHAVLGNTLSFAGQPTEGIASIETALHLNPQDPKAHFYVNMIARSYLTAKDYDRAVKYARESISRNSEHAFAHLVLASALGHLGRTEEAFASLEDCERVDPGRIAREFTGLPMVFRNVPDAEHILEGVRKTGWKE